MTCTRPRAESQKSLDPWVPSTHDPKQTSRFGPLPLSRFEPLRCLPFWEQRAWPEDRVERRLAAILAAEVAGYSRLMGADEEGTHALPGTIMSPDPALRLPRASRATGTSDTDQPPSSTKSGPRHRNGGGFLLFLELWAVSHLARKPFSVYRCR